MCKCLHSTMDTYHEVLKYELQAGMPPKFKDAGTNLHGLPCNHVVGNDASDAHRKLERRNRPPA